MIVFSRGCYVVQCKIVNMGSSLSRSVSHADLNLRSPSCGTPMGLTLSPLKDQVPTSGNLIRSLSLAIGLLIPFLLVSRKLRKSANPSENESQKKRVEGNNNNENESKHKREPINDDEAGTKEKLLNPTAADKRSGSWLHHRSRYQNIMAFHE